MFGFGALIYFIVGFFFSSKNDNPGQIVIFKSRVFPRRFCALTYSTIVFVSSAVLFNTIMKFDALSVLLPMAV
ncbi:GRP family sugar transporter [Streptococcus thoraltensis]